MVGRVLKESEERTLEATSWLSKEAARLDTVKQAGTFRLELLHSSYFNSLEYCLFIIKNIFNNKCEFSKLSAFLG